MGKKKKKGGEESGPDLIQIMTVSLFIILLAFFILLNAIAVVDDERRRVALGSLMENFGILSGGFSVMKGSGPNMTAEEVKKIAGLLDFSDMSDNDEDPVKGLIVTSNRKRSVVALPAHILFEPGRAEMKPSSRKVLDRLCRVVNETNYPVDIAGYMDKGTGNSNPDFSPRELTAMRSMALYRYFTEKGKVHPKLVTAYGWGEYRPMASNKVKEARVLNQRMEIVIAHEDRLKKPKGFFTFKNFFFNVFDE